MKHMTLDDLETKKLNYDVVKHHTGLPLPPRKAPLEYCWYSEGGCLLQSGLLGTPAELLETRLTSLRCHCNLMAECHQCPKAKLLHSAVKQEPGPHCCGFPSAFWWQLGGEQCGIASSRSQVRPGRVDLEPIQKTGYTQTSSGSHMHLDKTWHQRGWGTVR